MEQMKTSTHGKDGTYEDTKALPQNDTTKISPAERIIDYVIDHFEGLERTAKETLYCERWYGFDVNNNGYKSNSNLPKHFLHTIEARKLLILKSNDGVVLQIMCEGEGQKC